MMAERGEETAEEKCEASRGWFSSFMERSHFCNIKVPGEAANTVIEATGVIQKFWLR